MLTGKTSILALAVVLVLLGAGYLLLESGKNEPEQTETFSTSEVKEEGDPDAWLEGADIRNGQQLSRICVACHTFDEDGPRRFSTNLYGIVGSNYARDKDYKYSDAMKALSHKKWTTKDLDKWIQSPAGFIPGTNMLFNGLSEAAHRRDLIAYINSLKPDKK